MALAEGLNEFTQMLVEKFQRRCQPLLTDLFGEFIVDITILQIRTVASMSEEEMKQYWNDCKKHEHVTVKNVKKRSPKRKK
jgi:hypothetical protein